MTGHDHTGGWRPRIGRRTARTLLVRSVFLWAVLRLVIAAGGSALGVGFAIAPAVIPLFAAVVGLVLVVDLKGVREDLFLANLGVGARHAFAIAFTASLTLEVPLSLALAAFVNAS